MKTLLSTCAITLSLLSPAPAGVVGFYTYFQTYDRAPISAGGQITHIQLWDTPGVLRQQAYLSVTATALGDGTIRVQEDSSPNLTFLVLDNDDFFTFAPFGHGLNQQVSYRYQTPLPATAALFAVGIVLLGMAARKMR